MGPKSKQVSQSGAPRGEPWYEFKAQADDENTAELKIFGPIGGGFFVDEDAVTGKAIVEKLDGLAESITTIRVLVNSPGGSVFDAVHIANALRRQREELGRNVEVRIEALAASAATIVTSSGNSVKMPRNALMMVHNPWGLAMGDSKEMREVAEILDKVRATIIATYRWLSKLSAAKLGKLMDKETWMDSEEAVENGFATEITEAVKVQASIDPKALAQLGEIPDEYMDRVMALFESKQNDGDDGGAKPAKKREVIMSDKKKDSTPATPATTATPAAPKVPAPEPNVQQTVDAAEAAKAERARVLAVQDLVEVIIGAGGDPKKVKAAGVAAIANGDSLDKTRETLLGFLAKKSDALPPGGNGGHVDIVPGEAESDKRVIGITAALLHRAGVSGLIREGAKARPHYTALKDVELDPGEFRGMTLLEHSRESLERSKPGSSRGMTKMELAGNFFAQGGYQTTSDFATAMEAALHKILLAAYAISPDKWTRFCKVGQVTDFRVHNRYRLGFLGGLDVVLEDGEFTNKSLADATKETQQAITYGNMLGLSRQAIVNDDMGVFDNVAVTLGRAAGLSIELAVFALIAENSGMGPTMNDGDALWDDTAHSNEGAGAAISVAALDADRVIMAAQTDASGNEILDLRPTKLLVPAGIEGAARVINRSEWDHDGTKLQRPNMVQGLFDDIIGTGRLTGTRRYMFADPSIAPTIEVAFLEGEQEPYMELQDGWRVDGVEWKVRHDFGVAAVDWRASLTDAGA